MVFDLRAVMSRESRLARRVGRWAYMEADGDLAKAEELFRKHESIARLDAQTVILMLKIAFDIWQWWTSRGIKEPSVVASSGEPYSDDDD